MEAARTRSIDQQGLVQEQSVTPARSLLTGIITGQAAGLIMAVVVMIVFTVFLGKGPLYPVQVIGSVLLGEDALKGMNLTAVLTGLLLHQLGPSLLWGAIFGLLTWKFRIETVQQSLLTGIALGIVSMIGPYVLIPAIGQALHGVDLWNREVPMFWDWAAHLVFGASFALYPTLKRRTLT